MSKLYLDTRGKLFFGGCYQLEVLMGFFKLNSSILYRLK